MSVNIKLGNNTLSNVDSVRFEDADTQGQYDVFVPYKKPIDPDADVLFYDYDGTILYSYSKEEFLALTEMPANPTHEGLTAQGWNSTLVEAQNYVQKYEILNVGQLYVTDDGKTRLYIEITDPLALNIPICFMQKALSGITINWGDGSAEEVVSTGTYRASVKMYDATTSHQYSSLGQYIITFSPINNCSMMLGNYTYSLFGISNPSTPVRPNGYIFSSVLKKIELGENVLGAYGYGIQCCVNLETITLSKQYVALESFNRCEGLKHLNLPSYVTINTSYAFPDSLQSISYPVQLDSTALSYVTVYPVCGGSKRVCLPTKGSCTTIYNGSNGEPVTLVIPDEVGYSSLERLYQLKQILPREKAFLFDIYFKFGNNVRLSSVNIAQGSTAIAAQAFVGCVSLSKLIFPSSITSINALAFLYCSGIQYYDFSQHESVPTLGSSNAFQNNNDTYQIRVPNALLDEWKAATNWSAVATHIVGV